VEFALVAPIFVLLLFSIIEFGRAIYVVEMLNNAAREGARYAIVHGANSTQGPSGPYPATYPTTNPYDPTGAYVVARVKQFAIAIPDSNPGDFVVTVKWCDADGGVDSDRSTCPDTNSVGQGDGSNDRNEEVKVEVTYTFRPLVGIVPLPTFTLTGGSTLVINN
jgi:Flp pilus assembly protein TadG